jgi:excisionase family DNA binding protein
LILASKKLPDHRDGSQGDPVFLMKVSATEGFLTLQELSELLGVGYKSLSRALVLGHLPGEKVRGKWRIPRAEIDHLLAGEFGRRSLALVDDLVTITLRGKPRLRRAPFLPRPRGREWVEKCRPKETKHG